MEDIVKRIISLVIRAAASLVLLPVMLIASEAFAQSTAAIEQLYQAAKQEGALTIYAGGAAAPHERRAAEFEKRFPGIKVSVTADFSNILAPKIDEQIQQGKLGVDLTIFQTLQDYARWKKTGVLLPFKPDGFDQIDPSFKDKDGAYVGVWVSGLSYGYNTENLTATDVPKSALDFLKSKFSGKLITTYPQDDDVTLYLFSTIVAKYGWEYMDKYMANRPSFVRGHLGVSRSIAAGENVVTFDAIVGSILAEARNGKPAAVAISTIDPLPIWPQTAAIFKDAPHPNAAKLFISWLLEKEQQSRVGTWSSRSDVPPPPGLKPLPEYKLANDFSAFINDEARANELRKRFEAYIGPVKGTPTIR
jgi:ABC-type Fe3+ transport system substrate-binding protein